MKKQTKKIEIMTTQEEYEQLLQRKTKPRLAEWIRETCLNQKPRKEVATVDPLRGRLRERAKSYAKALANDILR